jgi:hypothetical protein
MKIDLTSPEKAAQYLASLDTDEVIEIPDRFQKEPHTAAQDALLVAFKCSCSDLGSRFGYEIEAGVAVETLKADAREAEENRTITTNNEAIRKSIEAIFDARATLYTQATEATEPAIYKAIYTAIDAMSAQITALESQRIAKPISDVQRELEAELALA